MMLKVFAVYDLKTKAYMQPFFSPESGSAMRAFGDAVLDMKSPIAMHPADYQLFEVGAWDDCMGHLRSITPVKLLCSGNDFVQEDKKKGVDNV